MTVEQLQKLDQLAEQALAARNYQGCHQFSLETLKLAPESPLPYYRLAIIASEHDNYAKAVDVVERGIAFDQSNPDMYALLAKCQLILNHHDSARNAAEKALSLDISRASTLDTLGVTLSRLGEHEKAIQLFSKVAKLQPNRAEHHYNLAASQQFMGLFDAAEASYEQAIRLKPNYYRAHSSLSNLTVQTLEQNHCARLETLYSEIEQKDEVDAKLHIGHALAKEREDLEQPEASFSWLKKAKEAKLAAIQYNFDKDKILFDSVHRLLDKQTPLETQPSSGSSEAIFIVGMPRTGTTLVERILSSDDSVFAAGELTNFALLLKRRLNTESPYVLDPETLATGASADLSGLGDDYIASTRPRTGHCPRFIDKMPLNFFYAAHILKAMPDAKVVCVLRNPMDTCLSNFRQLFSTKYPYYNYAYDLQATARYVLEFNRLIQRYTQCLGSNFITINYDQLIAEPAARATELMSALELEYMPEYLDFHKNNRAPVSTASSIQVRKPIYSSSVGRWKKYGDLLKPALDVFDSGALSYQ